MAEHSETEVVGCRSIRFVRACAKFQCSGINLGLCLSTDVPNEARHTHEFPTSSYHRLQKMLFLTSFNQHIERNHQCRQDE